MKKYNIGIIGNGFVGSAVSFGFSAQCGFDANIRIYDVNPKKSTHKLLNVCNDSNFIFVSIPTPNKDGVIDLSAVNQVFYEINQVNNRDDNYFFLRSTVTPNTTRKLAENYPYLNIVFNPEFLTERTAKFDFINPSRIIIGNEKGEENKKIKKLFDDRFSNSINIQFMKYEEAELIKYMCNCYFATKLSFLNEIYQISEKLMCDWETVRTGWLSDGRIGNSHSKIALDGKLGYGGACLPKDIQALTTFADSLGIDAQTMKGAIKTNNYLRK